MVRLGCLLLLVTVSAFSSAKTIPLEHDFGIVGGERVNITEVPYQVYMIREGEFSCGGSIISRRHIVTAAHCLHEGLTSDDYIIVVGTDDNKHGGTKYGVSKLTKHEDYGKGSTFDSDIGVMTLSRKISLSEKARPIRLVGPKYITKDGASLIATGWGDTRDSFIDERYLRKVVVPKVSTDECKIDYGDLLTDSMLCAGVAGKDTCQGDSGGPLVKDSAKGKLLVGVTSWGGPGCARPGKPGVYTKVSKFYKWIKNIVKEDNEQLLY